MLISAGQVEQIFTEYLHLLVGGRLDGDPLDEILHTVACKAALKARVKNRPEDDENVVRMLSENPHLRYCPHGRPFIKKLPKREIEKYFDR